MFQFFSSYIGGVTTLQSRGRKPYVHVNRVNFRYPVWYLQKERYVSYSYYYFYFGIAMYVFVLYIKSIVYKVTKN